MEVVDHGDEGVGGEQGVAVQPEAVGEAHPGLHGRLYALPTFEDEAEVLIAEVLHLVLDRQVAEHQARLQDEVLAEVVLAQELAVEPVHEPVDLLAGVDPLPAGGDHREQEVGLGERRAAGVGAHEDVEHAVVVLLMLGVMPNRVVAPDGLVEAPQVAVEGPDVPAGRVFREAFLLALDQVFEFVGARRVEDAADPEPVVAGPGASV